MSDVMRPDTNGFYGTDAPAAQNGTSTVERPPSRRRGRPPTRPAAEAKVRFVDPEELRLNGAFPRSDDEPPEFDESDVAAEDELPAGFAPDAEEWPHTESVVRRQVVDIEDERVAARVKRAHKGDRPFAPILSRPEPTEEERRIAEEMERPESPSRSPILDYLGEHAVGTASDIAGLLGREPNNVSTRLRQLEEAGYVRRTGRMVPGPPGARGGPRVEWELADPDKPPTGVGEVLDGDGCSRPVPRDEMRRAYFDALLDLIRGGAAEEHVFDRAERVAGVV